MARKRAKDYRKEFHELNKELNALEARIRKRLETLCKEHPEVKTRDVTFAEDIAEHVHRLSVDGVLLYIERIEKELADRHPHKQTTINYTPEDPICNCDGRDMPVYKEDGKNWCPQCGYEVK